jgi:hypothetical protein
VVQPAQADVVVVEVGLLELLQVDDALELVLPRVLVLVEVPKGALQLLLASLDQVQLSDADGRGGFVVLAPEGLLESI